jgi:hypothetical protein
LTSFITLSSTDDLPRAILLFDKNVIIHMVSPPFYNGSLRYSFRVPLDKQKGQVITYLLALLFEITARLLTADAMNMSIEMIREYTKPSGEDILIKTASSPT